MALKTLKTITMTPVLYAVDDLGQYGEPLPHPPDEFRAGVDWTGNPKDIERGQHLIPIPNFPKDGRVVAVWWTPLDKIENLSKFKLINVEVRKPDTDKIFLESRVADRIEGRIRLKVYILVEWAPEIKKERGTIRPT